MRIEQALTVEAESLADQAAECGIRCRLDGREHPAEKARQAIGPQRESGHDAEASSAATLDRPK